MNTTALLRQLAIVATTLMLASGCALASRQAEADREAAVIADKVLAPYLERELKESQVTSEQHQIQALYSWLTSPSPDFIDSLNSTGGTRWVAGAPEGSIIPVVVYLLWSDTTFVEDRRWGRVCREYHVGKTRTWRAVSCPADTPSEPPTNAVGGKPQ